MTVVVYLFLILHKASSLWSGCILISLSEWIEAASYTGISNGLLYVMIMHDVQLFFLLGLLVMSVAASENRLPPPHPPPSPITRSMTRLFLPISAVFGHFLLW